MAIMVAGGLTFAIPGTEPAFAEVSTSNPHLYVSAEGQDPDNMFAQGNIIEVIIRDDTIGDTDEGEAEPEVTINGADLRMLQTANGYWTAYFAEVDALADIDSLNYGVYCSESSSVAGLGVPLTDSNGAYFPPGSTTADSNDMCSTVTGGDTPPISERHPLIREPRALTDWDRKDTTTNTLGQLGLASEKLWPFIQVFDFASEGDVEIVYNKGGTRESVTLTFDDPSESHTLDRQKYPQGAHVHIELMDYALNIDPTDEDVWVFDTQNSVAYYNVFNEDGGITMYTNDPVSVGSEAGIDETVSIDRGAQGTDVIDCQLTKDFGMPNLADPNQDYLMADDDSGGACVPTSNLGSGASDVFAADTFAIGFVEDGSNNNVFINWAEDQRSNIVVKDDALRGNSFEVDYSSPGAKSGVVGHFFGELTFEDPDGVWNSGERITVSLADEDFNKNPLAEEIASVDVVVGSQENVKTFEIDDDYNPIVIDTVDPDTTPPTIRLNGGDVTLVQRGNYPEQGAACVDDRDASKAATASGTVDVNTIGNYTITYTCTDSSGNVATPVDRNVEVTEADTTAPTIMVTPGPERAVQGSTYADPGAVCSDNVDADKPATPSGPLDTSQLVPATIQYTCTDSSSNTAAPVTRTVEIVEQDNEAPVITLNDGLRTVVQGTTYNDPGAVCADNVDGDSAATPSGPLDTSTVGPATIEYTCTDSSNNVATPVTRTVEVVELDNEAPTITLNGESTVNIVRGSIPSYTDPGAVCEDNVDQPKDIMGTGTVNTGRTGTYILTYTCTDSSNNAATPVDRTINVGLPVVLTSIVKGDAGWVDGAYDLVVKGTISSDERDIVLDTDDIEDFVPEPVPTNDDGSIDTTVLLTDIRASGDITFTLAASDGSEESNPVTVRNIPSILRLGAITAGDWIIDNGPRLALTITGSEGVGAADYEVNLATAADPETSLIPRIDFADEPQIMRNLTTTAITGPTQFVLVATDDDGVVTMSGARTANIPPVLTADIARAAAWDNGILKLTITGSNNTDLATYGNVALLYGDTVFGLTAGALAADGSSTNTVEVNSTGIFGTVDFNDISTADTTSDMQLVFDTGAIDATSITTSTTQIESPTVSVGIPTILELTRLDIASTWNEGSLGLRVAGSEGIASGDTVTLDAPDVEGFTAIGITQTDGTIQAIVSTTHIGLSGDTVFRLQGTSGDNEAYSNNMTIRIPPALTLTGIDRDGTWNEGSLTLNVNGTELISGNDVDLFYQVGTEWTDVGVDVSGTSGTITDATATFSDISVSGDTVFRLQSGTGDNVAVSNTGTVNIPPILILNSATNPTWNTADTELTFSIDGMESVSGATVTFEMLSTEGGVLGTADTSVASTGGTIFTQATITGLDAANVGSSALVRLTSGTASSLNLTVTNIPANFTSQSVDMTPTPIVQHNSGFPPITRAVIGNMAEIPAIHNVQETPNQAPLTYMYDPDTNTISACGTDSPVYVSGEFQYQFPMELPAAVASTTTSTSGSSTNGAIANMLDPYSGTSSIVNAQATPDAGPEHFFTWDFSVDRGFEIMDVSIVNAAGEQLWSAVESGIRISGQATSGQVFVPGLSVGGTGAVVLHLIQEGDPIDVQAPRVDLKPPILSEFDPESGEINNAAYRIELEETGADSGVFEGTIEYVMLNQLNKDKDSGVYDKLRIIGEDVLILVSADMTDEDSIRIQYTGLGADGVMETVTAQQEAPTHSGVVSLDAESYKIADTVTITVEDSDLNTDNDVIDIYPIMSGYDTIGDGSSLLLHVTFDDETWTENGCTIEEFGGPDVDKGLGDTGFTLIETAQGSGVFTGTFQIPPVYCQKATNNTASVTGVDIEVNYQDFRDSSGSEIEVGAGASVRANTGTVSFDRTVYPVPISGDDDIEDASGEPYGAHDLTIQITEVGTE